jgi:hypothetical protein
MAIAATNATDTFDLHGFNLDCKRFAASSANLLLLPAVFSPDLSPDQRYP